MMKREKKYLEDLSFTELHILLGHLRLGMDHLKQLLSPQQFQELIHWSGLTQDQKEKITSDKAEKTGNLALVINTILTSTFGAWMGLSGCFGSSLGSLKMLTFVGLLAFFVSGVLGYISLKYTKNQARQAVNTQRLHNLEFYLLQMINQKLDKKMETEIQYLNTAIFLLEQDKEQANDVKNIPQTFDNALEAFSWLKHLKGALKQRTEHLNHTLVYLLYWSEFSKIIKRIRKIFTKHMPVVEDLAEEPEDKPAQQEDYDTSHVSFLKLLTDPAFAISKFRTSASSWFKGNVGSIMLGLIPTIWGGFASMFVFVGGFPNIARELGLISVANFLIQPWARVIELMLALTVTLYFGFSSIHLSRKLFQRKQLLDKTQKEITNEETRMLEKNHKLQLLLKVRTQIQKVVSIFNVLKKIDISLIKTNESTGTYQVSSK